MSESLILLVYFDGEHNLWDTNSKDRVTVNIDGSLGYSSANYVLQVSNHITIHEIKLIV